GNAWWGASPKKRFGPLRPGGSRTSAKGSGPTRIRKPGAGADDGRRLPGIGADVGNRSAEGRSYQVQRSSGPGPGAESLTFLGGGERSWPVAAFAVQRLGWSLRASEGRGLGLRARRRLSSAEAYSPRLKCTTARSKERIAESAPSSRA